MRTGRPDWYRGTAGLRTSCPRTSCWWCCSVCWKPLKSSVLQWTESPMSSYSWWRHSRHQFHRKMNTPETTNRCRVPSLHTSIFSTISLTTPVLLFMRTLSLIVSDLQSECNRRRPGPLDMAPVSSVSWCLCTGSGLRHLHQGHSGVSFTYYFCLHVGLNGSNKVPSHSNNSDAMTNTSPEVHWISGGRINYLCTTHSCSWSLLTGAQQRQQTRK